MESHDFGHADAPESLVSLSFAPIRLRFPMRLYGGAPAFGLVFSHEDHTVNSEAEPLREFKLMPRSLADAFCMKASSMLSSASHSGHSAQVNMRLLVNGLSLTVAQMGPDFVLVDTPVNHPPADASLVLQVDQAERRWRVNLPDGISANTRRVTIGAAA